MVLGDHVEVLRQGTVGEKAVTPSCTQITCNGPSRWFARALGSNPLAGPGFHDRTLQPGRSDAGCAGRDFRAGPGDRRGERSRNSGASLQSLCKVRIDSGAPA